MAGNKKKYGHWIEHWLSRLLDQFVHDGSPFTALLLHTSTSHLISQS